MWVMIFALVVSWLLQMFWINWGLVHCPAIFIISLEAVFNELIAVLGGMLYFQEYKAFTAEGIAVFSVGVLLSLVGVAVIATRPQELKMHDATGHDLLEARRAEDEDDCNKNDADGGRENEERKGKGGAGDGEEDLEAGGSSGGSKDKGSSKTTASPARVSGLPRDIVGVMDADAGAGGVQVLLTKGR